ncbi:serine/threonine-protein kinase haspin homolog [Euphorbia lathyris]|uniref:serine/threonine-protein kinase haspin homolog n=1 Tax=Euphorbia lathyris TaxID=212925 RepID=UPI00331341F5
MSSRAGGNEVDLWSQIVAEESDYCDQHNQPKVEVFYRRRRPRNTPPVVDSNQLDSNKENRVSFVAAVKRVSWNRALSIRGRVSIAVAACVENQPGQKQAKRKGKPPVPKGKAAKPLNFEMEKEYFQEVDAFELLEESPSPKSFGTWATGSENENIAIPHLSSRLEQWLISKKLNFSCEPSTTLSKLLETPAMPFEPLCGDDSGAANLRTPEKFSLKFHSSLHSVHSSINALLLSKYLPQRKSGSQKNSSLLASSHDDGCKDIETAIKKLSFASTSTSLDHEYLDPFSALMAVCAQTLPSTLLDVFSKYCNPDSIVKVGEGTYGEAFKAGNTVCKIVPIDGDLVNGEVQKKSEELLEEAVLSRTLNHLRGSDNDSSNACTTFIETLDLRVCQGPYDKSLIKAWEDWDEKHGSENDHPEEFPEKQCYVVFVLQHGGKDLESFVLMNFDEARSLLVQVTAALAVAEAAFEFEHRDLHWGNILLSRNESATVQFILEGKKYFITTHGLQISIIDFTLSRINTGEDILFLDLSSDPDLFTGPKGDKQSETYRKMKEVTEDSWEGSFPRTNVLWLIYLVDILLQKKSYERCVKNVRELNSLKKRLDMYNSAKEAIFDPFFSDMLSSAT